MSLQWQDIVLEKGPLEKTSCECCGGTTLTIEGDLFHAKEWLSFYMVRQSPNHPEAYPVFRFGIGDWSEDAQSDARWIFEAEHDPVLEGFRILDMSGYVEGLTYTPLCREDIIGTPYAETIFAMLDAVFMKEPRLEDLRA